MGHCELTTVQNYCACEAHEPSKIVYSTTEYKTKGSVFVAKVGPELTVTALQVSIDALSVTRNT